ncbi:hypothetical protein COLO4_35941 [Corchorus olitorius]|uniref:ATPase, AAA-type, core n=1 Tax=Corchorus olitorius TaxID=93759 RepID=A0A1R3GBS0_9ROSI|nr:hypothetical protein COLO4_35941 [Corchorus olitorius]
MDESTEKKEPEGVMVNGTDQTERRSVRRRLVQSTLFPHKSPEIEPKVEQKDKEGEDDNNDGEDEEFCGSQGKKRGRKRKAKVTPPNRASKKAKEKSPKKTTPKKNGMNNLVEIEDSSPPPIPNLRLEAKLTAEENSRIFAGRQIHPFFASLKVGKKSQETAEDCQLDEVTVLSKQADNVETSELEMQTRLCQESLEPDNSLWTDKYQPKKATEVCGNTESVKFMSEWLHQWREGSFQAVKASNNIDNGNMQEDDYICSESDFDSENFNGEDSLKKVLLVTGPIGMCLLVILVVEGILLVFQSGKSAAISACAKEQGFIILESNASDCRNGAVVKEKYGEALVGKALESLYGTRSQQNPIDSLGKHVTKSEFGDEVIEFISISDEEDSFGAHGASGKHVCIDKETGSSQVKKLLLFEDVDIIFPEDRGFIAAIQQIVEKAKGPVILTSNSNDLVLPANLDRLELRFTMPSPEELLHHLHMVCAAEKATTQPHLLEQLIKSCQGDIRKTIMHLQFWCQREKIQKGDIPIRAYMFA